VRHGGRDTRMLFFTTMPLWLSGILLIGLPTVIAMAGPVVIRRFVQLDKLRTNNEVAGFKFATVGVIYAVLLAFMVVLQWETYSGASDNASAEAISPSRKLIRKILTFFTWSAR